MAKCELLPPTISTTILLGGSESCFNLFSYFLIFLHMTLFLENSYRPNQPPYTIFFQAKMCRNVQTKISDRAPFGPRLSPTSSQNPKQKMEKKFLLTSQKINIIIDFFLIIIYSFGDMERFPHLTSFPTICCTICLSSKSLLFFLIFYLRANCQTWQEKTRSG